MNNAWMKFLTASGAVIANGAVAGFGDEQAELDATGGSVIADLSHRGLIAARGEDTVTFLQGQLTCDMQALAPRRSLLGAWCSSKGRVLTLFRIWMQGDTVLLEMPRDRLGDTLAGLRKYVLRARVAFDDESDAYVRIGLSGEAASALLSARFGELPEQDGQVAAQAGATVIRLGGGRGRFEVCFDDPEVAKQFWSDATATLVAVGAHAWELMDIADGLPGAATPDEYLPQMLNLDQLGGVSFTKGCYVGQEIVARTHHLGRLKRRMYRLAVDADAPPRDNAPLFRQGADESDEADGRLLMARQRPGGGYAGLAVVKLDAVELPLRLGAGDGVPVEILPAPYAELPAGG